MPVSSRYADSVTDEESESDEAPKKRKLTMQEKAIYLESDALQIEMGNIVSKTGTGGTIIYDTARTNQHKDRYSALAMAVRYIAELEEARIPAFPAATGEHRMEGGWMPWVNLASPSPMACGWLPQ